RLRHVLIASGIAVVAAAEWLHGGAAGGAAFWAWATGAAGVVAVAAYARALPLRPRQPLPGAAALASLALGAVLVATVLATHRIECCWPALRERRVTDASLQLATTLTDAVAEAGRLAERGATAALLPGEARFARLEDAVQSGPASLERGVVVLDSVGEPLAWAGRHRAIPA